MMKQKSGRIALFLSAVLLIAALRLFEKKLFEIYLNPCSPEPGLLFSERHRSRTQ